MILVDTNVLVAAARTADTHHVAAARLLRETDDRFLVAPTVLAETCYLLHEFGGPAPEVAFLRSIAAGELDLAVLTVADVVRMTELAERYADLGGRGRSGRGVPPARRAPWSATPHRLDAGRTVAGSRGTGCQARPIRVHRLGPERSGGCVQARR